MWSVNVHKVLFVNDNTKLTMVRCRTCIVKGFVYCAFVMSVILLVSFIWLEKTDQKDVFFDGPEVRNAEDVDAREQPTEDHILDVLYAELARRDELSFVNCKRLFENNFDEIKAAKLYLQSHNYTFPLRKPNFYSALTVNCDRFRKSRGYMTSGVTQTEQDFPLAFIILVHEKVEQFERLLRVIYKPNNQYCIHVDKKAPDDVMKSILAITRCFDNVFVASRLEMVIYKSYTRLKADINCMKDLVDMGRPWKYLINMASSEFPIMTNLQIVQMARILNGANDIHEVFLTMDENRFLKRHFTYIDLKQKTGHVIYSETKKDPPPHNLVITKGNAYNLFSREFVEFVLSDKKARDLLSWSADTLTPDEHFWATLNNLYSNPFLNTPGGYKGHPDTKPYFGRYIGWNSTMHTGRCKARHYVHNVCLFGVEDLPAFQLRKEIIANKFDIGYDPIAYKCMEEWSLNKTRSNEGIRHERLYKKLALVK